MKKINFTTFINAPVAKVWDTMLEDSTYRQWTKAFNGDSRYKGSWEEGSKIIFLGLGAGEEENGMLSRIKENRLHEFISIEHYGMIVNGKEDTTSEEVKKWTPAHENYTFVAKDGGTELTVDMDMSESHKEMFEKMWPEALKKLKELAEK